MNSLKDILRQTAAAGVKSLFGKEVEGHTLTVNETNPEFPGDYTLVLFPLAKLGLGKPEEFGNALGEYIVNARPEFSAFNIVKGFLNLTVHDAAWSAFLLGVNADEFLTLQTGRGKKVFVEFSSPNTNKPLHLGHLRNNFLGFSVARILEACGYEVTRTCLVNDRGIAICKSMLMYQKYGNGATPQSEGKKPDFFVVKYYVQFGDELEKQVQEGIARGLSKDDAEKQAPLMAEAREMLLKWEAGDAGTRALWKQLNDWVYEGFEQTYKRIGVVFDKMYYESETWLLGKDIVDEGLAKNVFTRREDNSVWLDMRPDGLDEKVMRRADGTTLYITQDLGTARARYEEMKMDLGIYVVADEQDYHFKVLFLALKKMGYAWADGLYHLSYGMVDLPEGRMKTRTGTTVDADPLMDEVVAAAAAETAERGKTEGMSTAELADLHEKIGLAALRFFLLKVNPRKRMVFNPRESVDINGFTGPFVQYAYARTQALVRKAQASGLQIDPQAAAQYTELQAAERTLLRTLSRWPEVLLEAREQYDPSAVANFSYALAQAFNRFYHEVVILQADQPAATAFRLRISALAADTFRKALNLLGIETPDRM